MKRDRYDAVVIGAGVNGLVTAALLAKRGRSVLLAEASEQVGGLAASIEFHEGYRSGGVLHDPACVRPAVIRELALEQHGLELRSKPASVLLADGDQTVALEDAEPAALRDMHAFIDRVRPVLAGFCDEPSVDLIAEEAPIFDLLKRGLRLRRLGRADMLEVMRIAPMCSADWLNERFDHDLLKAGLALPALIGEYAGPWSPGTNAILLLREAMRGPGLKKGSPGLVSALERVARKEGVEIACGSPVDRIVVGRDGVEAVRIGERTIACAQVASSLDPRSTFFDLIDPMYLSARLEHHVRTWRARPTTAQLLIALDRQPAWGAVDYVRVAGHVDEIEKAFDPIKYREIPERPVLDVAVPTQGDPSLAPEGHAVLSVLASFVPERFADAGSEDGSDEGAGWTAARREQLTERVLDRLCEIDPDLRDAIVKTELRTPDQLGNLNRGEHGLDQILVRPFPESSTHASPIRGLYLCGASTHPGGGVHGGCGVHAGRRMLATR